MSFDRPSRRGGVVGVCVGLASLGGLAGPAFASDSFADPGASERPLYRFWNNGGMDSSASIEEQVAQIKSSGAGGFEANQLSGVPGLSGTPGYDPLLHGFGTPEWTRAWTQLFQSGTGEGMEVDQIYTPGWSAGIQDISPDEPGTAKEIAFGSLFLDGGEAFTGDVPTVALPAGVTKRVLQGLIAYRCESNCSGSGSAVPVLDPASAVDLTATVADGSVSYTAPAGAGRHVLVAAWMQGTGQTIALAHTPTPSFMVDHFGAAGAQAIIDYWDSRVLTPELRAAFQASGGSMFFDSLELNHEDRQIRHWTDDFLTEFQQRRGYSLIPYLATVATSDPAFEFSGSVGERVREDYQQTLSELFVANHINPIKQWAHSFGMTLRGQAYSSWGPNAIDAADAAIALDIPEQEANNRGNPLFAVDGSDTWRQIVSANAQVGKNLVSGETGTFGRMDGLARISLVARINEQVGLGLNKVVYHGWADQAPGAADRWPGYYPFLNYVGDNYGPQNPTFADDKTINDYVGRLQTVLRRGQLRNDVAIYWDGVRDAHFADTTLERAGYTYGFMNNTLVTDPSATVSERRLSRLGYRAFVLDGLSASDTMDLATAKRILSWARGGFPIVVVGDLPERVRGYHPAQDAALRGVIADLLAQDSVTTVPNRAAVLGALKAAGVESSAAYDQQPLVTLHRQSSDSDYYYLFNAARARTSATVTLKERRPYRYDAWTGTVTPIAQYTRTKDGVQLTVDLATGDSDLIALTSGNAETPQNACTIPVTGTTGDTVLAQAGSKLVLRDSQPGQYTSTLADGQTITTTIPTVPAPLKPASWNLDVTSWQAGGSGADDTAKVALAPITVTPGGDGTLPDWQQISGLGNTSGTAVYRTTIDVGPAWSGGTGAYLDLGSVFGTVQVSVNGTRLPVVDLVDLSRIDLGGHLQAGSNTIEVQLATPIINAGFRTRDTYGLVGPVAVTPYGQADLVADCRPAEQPRAPVEQPRPPVEQPRPPVARRPSMTVKATVAKRVRLSGLTKKGLLVRVVLPRRGKVALALSAKLPRSTRATVLARASRSAKKAGTVSLRLKPTSRTAARLRLALRARRSVTATVAVTSTLVGAKPRTQTLRITIRR